MNSTLPPEVMEYLEKKVREHLASAPGCHDFDHTLRVVNNCMQLTSIEKQGNPDIIRAAALLHDIARPEEMLAAGKVCHAERGAVMAEELLRAHGGIPERMIEAITDAVRCHRYRDGRKPVTLEAKIVYDGDKLDSIGCVGVGRAFHFAGRIGARLHNCASEAINSPAYGNEDTAYREYLVKLRLIAGQMMTAAGRRLARERSDFMHLFFERLNLEIYGEAIPENIPE